MMAIQKLRLIQENLEVMQKLVTHMTILFDTTIDTIDWIDVFATLGEMEQTMKKMKGE